MSFIWKIVLSVTLLLMSPHIALAVSDDVARYVDPFIGTGGQGNTLPGATLPWGMIYISPDNEKNIPSGYKFGSAYIYGFSLTHLSGTGCKALGNISLMPYSDNKVISNLKDVKSRYREEKAEPGYYSVNLTDHKVTVDIAAAVRSGSIKITGNSKNLGLLIDLESSLAPSVEEGYIRVISPFRIEGWQRTKGFCSPDVPVQTVFYSMEFSKGADTFRFFSDESEVTGDIAKGDRVKAIADFIDEEQVDVRVGISYVSIENARNNLSTELPYSISFEQARKNAYSVWNKELSKILVTMPTGSDLRVFYTALYHSLLHPGIYSDNNGEYATPFGIRIADGYTHYHVYSLWDTYRTVHPLLALVYPERNRDMIVSLVKNAEETGWVPLWELTGSDAGVMVGDPGSIVITDAAAKGLLTKKEVKSAYDAVKRNADVIAGNPVRKRLEDYTKYGFIPWDLSDKDKQVSVVSRALEYYLSDWHVAELANLAGSGDYERFRGRSGGYRNIFDSEQRLFRPKAADGSWLSPFNPFAKCCDIGREGSGGQGFTEGSAWQYSFSVPHDIPGLKELYGSENSFVQKLQSLFDRSIFTVTNEPDLYAPYLFTYVPKESWRTATALHKYVFPLYKERPDGIPGNDDTGTLSAYYVWSALGLFPVLSASNTYQIGSPLVLDAKISLNTDFYPEKLLTIRTTKESNDAKYIKRFVLNNGDSNKTFISINDIVYGGVLEFFLSEEKTDWGVLVPTDSPIKSDKLRKSDTCNDAWRFDCFLTIIVQKVQSLLSSKLQR